MAFTNAGLTNNGQTAHYSVYYDDSFPQATGRDRANALLAVCEQDFALMSSWFGGIDLAQIPVYIEKASGGGETIWWWGGVLSLTIRPEPVTSLTIVRYILVSEITELLMKSQGKGWFATTNEGSRGEGLSRFLSMQFLLSNQLGSISPSGFGITSLWLNSPRQDFVNNNPDDINPDAITGCTTLFLYYLHDQLGCNINDIVAAGSSNLSGVYQNLMGGPDGWTPFISLVNSHYPPGFTYTPVGDSIFPVSELSAFGTIDPITCGYSESTQILIDRPAKAQVEVGLGSLRK